MEGLSIGTTSHLDALEAALVGAVAVYPSISVHRAAPGGPDGLRVFMITPTHGIEAAAAGDILDRVAGALAAVIIDDFEPDLLRRILHRHYGSFTDAERRRILAFASRHLDEGPRGSDVYRTARREAVRGAIRAYLAESTALHLEGLVTFRLADYMADLEEAAGRAVDDFLIEREYREFIRLLRYFVSTQPPRMGEVHLWVQGSRFELFAADGQRLESSPAGIVELDTVEAEVSLEDLLISTLIEASPRRIVVHCGARASSHAETVRRVFGNRMERCGEPSCLYCEGLGALTDRHEAP